MSGLMDLIQQHITPETVNRISREIGEDPATTQQAISAAIPHLASAAEQQDGLVAGGEATPSMLGGLGGLGGMMSGGAAGSGGAGGMLDGLAGMMGGGVGDVLGNILGGKHADVQDGVSKQTGLDPQKTGRILMMLAPIVLQALAAYRQRGGSRP
jgi:hypothetical protein